jgi:dipeptidyl aminopeptidase/acylaminoacyl peptidase
MGYLMSTLLVSTCLAAPAKENEFVCTPKKMMDTKIISDVQLSPNNEHVLFVATEAMMTAEKTAYRSYIFKAKANGEEAPYLFSTSEHSSSQPRWSPDGKWIAFLSDRTGSKNLYLIPSEGGEAIALTNAKKDVQNFSWSPDSRKIAFVREDEKEVFRNRSNKAFVYKQDTTINRLWTVDVLSKEPEAKSWTTDEFCVRGCGDFGTIQTEFDWSSDGKKIVFAFSPSLGFDAFHLDSSIAVLDLETGAITPWAKKMYYEALPRFSPDGQSVAYLCSDSENRYAMNRRVALRSLTDEEGFQLLAPTFNAGPFIAGQSLLGWSQDGKSVLFYEPKETKFHVVFLSIDGLSFEEWEVGDYFFKDPSLSYDRTKIGCVVQAPGNPPEAYVTEIDHFRPIQISRLNEGLFPESKMETEKVFWDSIDGEKIEGLLTYPANYQEGRTYPMLLVIHGGPMGFFDETFLGTPNPYPLASFAEAGFAILRPNPRGSCGYGEKFRCSNYGDWGGMDFHDIMAGVDAMIARGIADPEKLGVMGWSYGGYMTAWAITQTKRFKAASMGAGLCNLISMIGTTDLYRFMDDYLGDFFKSPDLYYGRSPIFHIQNIETPCLIQHGLDDKRVPVSQAYEFYHALAHTGKDVKLVLYPTTGHRFTDPKLQLEALEENLAWFQKHLMEMAPSSN